MGSGDSGAVDIHALFCRYNALYFDDSLGPCSVTWTSSLSGSCAGTCHYYPGGGCEIVLSERSLKFRPIADLKNTLLHEMIHAFLWIRNKNNDHSDHGSSFQSIVESIASSSAADCQRPSGGYNITCDHKFDTEVGSCILRHWICQLCRDSICSAIDREPSPSDCIENVGLDGYCDNPLCHWHSHKKVCSGSYTEVPERPAYNDNQTSSEDLEELQKKRFKGLKYMRRTVQRLDKAEGTADKLDGKKNTFPNSFPSAAAATGNPGVEELQKNMVKGPRYITRSAKRSRKAEQTADKSDSKKNKIPNFPSAAAATGNPGDNSSSKADPQGKIKYQVFKGNKSKTSHFPALEIPKRRRTDVSRKKHIDNSQKRRKLCQRKKDYAVIIPSLDLFTDEESDEDVEPLINKRTERRRKEKELKLFEGQALEIETIDKVSTSQAGCGRSDKIMIGDSLLGHENVENLKPSEICEKKIEAQGTTMVARTERPPRCIQAPAEQSNMSTRETANCSLSSQSVHDQDPSPSNVPVDCGAVKIEGDSCKGLLPLSSPVSQDVVCISDSD